jgi:hypothetical protein
MATDVDVQYFSHLNGLVLGNNWGDLIRLLDKALVTGIDFTQITAASIDAQGDVSITLFAAHNAMLFQAVELSGFTPNSLNQKYRIKGVPNTTQLILKPALDITERSITTMGTGKLASLGYDIIFRDTNDVKRVYRAKNPTAQHPFIRVDESLTSPDGSSGIYSSTYAKFAMVGLLERMDHIDDFNNPDVLQLPFDTSDPAKNWKITGTGTGVVRGWGKWYWAHASATGASSGVAESASPVNGNRTFLLTGDKDAFYFQRPNTLDTSYMHLSGIGLFDPTLKTDVVPNWFLMTFLRERTAGVSEGFRDYEGAIPLHNTLSAARFFCLNHQENNRLTPHIVANPILPDLSSGWSGLYTNTSIPALQIPFSDSTSKLRGTLKHVSYFGKNLRLEARVPTVNISESSMYVYLPVSQYGFEVFYLGELE